MSDSESNRPVKPTVLSEKFVLDFAQRLEKGVRVRAKWAFKTARKGERDNKSTGVVMKTDPKVVIAWEVVDKTGKLVHKEFVFPASDCRYSSLTTVDTGAPIPKATATNQPTKAFLLPAAASSLVFGGK